MTQASAATNLRVMLVSPAFKLASAELTNTVKYWANKGVTLVFRDHLLRDESSDLLCSESLRVRFEELKEAFESLDSKYVWSLRGGYGSHQLLPFFKDINFKDDKIFMGFSDNTSIHYFLNMHLNKASLHAPHPNSFSKNLHSEQVLKQMDLVLDNLGEPFRFENLMFLNKSQNKSNASIRGQVVGGNLTTLVSLLGTPFNKGASNKILFIEEVEEPAYKVIRHLTHMFQAGFFDGVSALIFGHMIHSNKNQEELIKKAVHEWSLNLKLPVLWGLSAGHEHKNNRPLWFMKKTELRLDEAPCLINNI